MRTATGHSATNYLFSKVIMQFRAPFTEKKKRKMDQNPPAKKYKLNDT